VPATKCSYETSAHALSVGFVKHMTSLIGE